MDRSSKILTVLAAFVGATSIGAGFLMSGRGRRVLADRAVPFAQESATPLPTMAPAPAPHAPSQPPRSTAQPTRFPMPADDFAGQYTPQLWGLTMVPFAVPQQVPIEFAVEWIAEESGGNPCAIGAPSQYGPDGNPREMGIAQFYNPDDLQFLKVTGAELRAYCSPVKVAYRQHDGSTIMGPSQKVTRLLTSDEMTTQARATIDKIVQCRSQAAHYAAAAGVHWPSSGVDFWRLVKLVHGLPGLVGSLARVTTALGRAPSSWSEYRHAIESGGVHCDANTEAYRAKFTATFNNAEKATSTMRGAAVA